MNHLNYLYPFGEVQDTGLEYQFHCPQCGKPVHLFLPTQLTHTGYHNGGSCCHPFQYSIDRGAKTLFPDKAIRLRKDVLGSRILLFDNYLLYPQVPGETEENRKARLIKIRQAELKTCLTEHPEKKNRIIETLVKRNETVLNTLEEILRVYEKTGPEDWEQLDALLEETTLQDDATDLLKRFHVEYLQTVRSAQGDPVEFTPFPANTLSAPSEEKKEEAAKPLQKPSVKEWICSCGTKAQGKFCPNCGSPSPEITA